MERLSLNTSNKGKLAEYQRLFSLYGVAIDTSQIDLKEIDAAPEVVVAHKASQVPEAVLIEDSSLDIDGSDVGVNIRWLLENLSDLDGRKASWTCLLAQRKGDQVHIYSGVVSGSIVNRRGEGGFGFDPYFLPTNEDLTLAQAKPDRVNARALAVSAFMAADSLCIRDPIYDWEGPWQ